VVEQFEDKTQAARNDILLTPEETAELLDVPVSTVNGLAEKGLLPSLPAGRGLEKRFRMNEVLAFMLK